METSPSQLPTDKKNKSSVWLIIGVIAGIVVGSGGMFLITQSANKPVPSLTTSSPSASATSTTITSSPSPSSSTRASNPVTTSTITQTPVKLPDLKLFISERPDEPYFVRPIVTYYQVGTIAEGKYAGYKKILAAVFPPEYPHGPQFFIFATKDDVQYVLDKNPENSLYFSIETLENSYEEMDKQKVTTLDTLPTSHPLTIKLDENFSLYKSDPYYAYEEFQSGQDTLSRIVLPSQPANTASLRASNTSLAFFSLPKPLEYIDPELKDYAPVRSTVLARDQAGLIYTYHLGLTKNVERYPASMLAYNKAYEKYNQALNKAIETNADTSTLLSPEYPLEPNLHFSKEDTISSTPLYSEYNTPFIAGCSAEIDALVMPSIKDDELKKVGTLYGVDVFALKNSTHPLIEFSFNEKVKDVEEVLFQDYNDHVAKPDLATYASKNPLLFFRDFWGRIVMMQETEYATPQECGKPVIYLYPEKETEISVQFRSPIDFTTAIPNYHDGWKVLAQSDGTLTDLQPKFTQCSTINTSHVGSEYAAQACKNNQYPYIYWSGKVLNKSYPAVAQGWVIAQADLAGFMHTTLDEIGFTTKEKTDMLEYWLPEMLKKNSPYYRVSFLQNQEMNEFVPMNIIPKPDSVYRLFLDWEPLENDHLILKPQQLAKVQREGFAVVEWGGLRR